MLTSISTNLAARPFRNERLPWFLAGLVLVLGLGVTALHAKVVDRILSGDEANTVRLVREDELRVAELEELIDKEPPLKVEAAELQRLRAFKELIDRRVFPWRLLLAELEETLSADVRLTSISPSARSTGRGMLIALSGEARSKDAAFSLAEDLDASAVFSNAVLKSLSKDEDVTRFELELVFDPPPAPSNPENPPNPNAVGSPSLTPPRTR